MTYLRNRQLVGMVAGQNKPETLSVQRVRVCIGTTTNTVSATASYRLTNCINKEQMQTMQTVPIYLLVTNFDAQQTSEPGIDWDSNMLLSLSDVSFNTNHLDTRCHFNGHRNFVSTDSKSLNFAKPGGRSVAVDQKILIWPIFFKWSHAFWKHWHSISSCQ